MAPRMGFGARLRALFGRGSRDEEFYEDLEDLLIEGDIAPALAMDLVDEVRGHRDTDDALRRIRELLGDCVFSTAIDLDPDRTNLLLILGVNGVGKTTNLAKLGQYYRKKDNPGVVFAAADTFRAAAVEQLATHGERLNIRTVQQGSGADATSVIFDSVSSARSKGERLVLADTAGRMHTKSNLVQELGKVDRVITSKFPDISYRKLLVVDATTGQNALHQAETFHGAVGVDAIILAKYDSTARGGILATIGRKLSLPCAFLGVGEGYDDLVPFDKESYLNRLLGVE
ncbi:MAG: signal recognition particle-docking protein FtsY [Spirochaetaceae bacterium]